MIPQVCIESMDCFWSRRWRMRTCGTMERIQEEAQIPDLQRCEIPQLISHYSDQTHMSLRCLQNTRLVATALWKWHLIALGLVLLCQHDSFGWSCLLSDDTTDTRREKTRCSICILNHSISRRSYIHSHRCFSIYLFCVGRSLHVCTACMYKLGLGIQYQYQSNYP